MTTELAGHQTPDEYLETHDFTRELKRLGVTNDQLQAMRFRGTNKGWPFDQWTFTWLDGTPHQAIPFVKAYCALKLLVYENPAYSRDKEDAWRCVNETMVVPTLAIGERTRHAQSKKAKKPRGKVTRHGKTLGQVIEQLALRPQYRSYRSKEIWPHLLDLLKEEDLDPKVINDRTNSEKLAYEYDFQEGRKRKRITFLRFENIVSRARAQKNHINRAIDTPSINSHL